MRKFASAGLLLMLSAAAPFAAGAQEPLRQGATITGSAVRTDLQPFPSAIVRLRSIDTAMVLASATTARAGEYAFSGVQPGLYILELVDVQGRLNGMTPVFSVKDSTSVAISIVAVGAGTLAASSGNGGFRLLGLGPSTSMAILGAAGSAAVAAVVTTRSDASPSR